MCIVWVGGIKQWEHCFCFSFRLWQVGFHFPPPPLFAAKACGSMQIEIIPKWEGYGLPPLFVWAAVPARLLGERFMHATCLIKFLWKTSIYNDWFLLKMTTGCPRCKESKTILKDRKGSRVCVSPSSTNPPCLLCCITFINAANAQDLMMWNS